MGILLNDYKNTEKRISDIREAVIEISEFYEKNVSLCVTTQRLYALGDERSKGATRLGGDMINSHALKEAECALYRICYNSDISPQAQLLVEQTLEYVLSTIPKMVDKRKEEILNLQNI
ncbi:MAG: hypothetical protein ACP5N2_00540 [Candidatus Nanoarchaeia archaeon]